jgi:hypothetical protein
MKLDFCNRDLEQPRYNYDKDMSMLRELAYRVLNADPDSRLLANNK